MIAVRGRTWWWLAGAALAVAIVTTGAALGWKPTDGQVQIMTGKAHIWVPAVFALTFLVLRTPWFGWKTPGPRQMFIMFGAVLAFQEAKHIAADAWGRKTDDITTWGLVFSAIALGWVTLDAGKTVYEELRPAGSGASTEKK